MGLKISLQRASKQFIPLFNIVWLLFVIQSVSAQNQADTAESILFASLENKAEPRYIIRTSNVVFPEILKGNEEEMLPYIEKYSTQKRDFLNKMYIKGKTFLPKAATILKKYNLPEELNILLVLESEYNGNAVSRRGAVGYWQIMDKTAGAYGMKYNAGLSKTVAKLRDDRKNFNLATHTAARYLRDSKRYVYDDWLLLVASYNCGVGRVRKAIRRSGKTDATFWDIKKYLPAETRAYVRNFITLNVIFNNYELFVNNKLNFAAEKIMLPEDLEKNSTEALSVGPDR